MKLAHLILILSLAAGTNVPAQTGIVHFVNGRWFNGSGFATDDFYAENGVLTHRPTIKDGVVTVDLHGGYVVPPFGDAHEHNFDSVANTPRVTTDYLRDGIFYAQGMTDVASGAAQVVAKQMVNTPATVDVTYAHGGLTGVNGHPKEVYESMANGFYYPQTPEQRALVIGSHKQDGEAYWEIGSIADLEAKWPKILAGKPDLIKIYLGGSEHFKSATAEDPQLGKGLDPELVAPIVILAHAAVLKVAAHIDTAADFHVALVGGVDEMGHMPGYGLTAKEDPSPFRLSDADIALCAKRHVKVQPTASLAFYDGVPPADLAARKASQIDNLRRLKAAGVELLVGTDNYGKDSLKEANYLQALGVFNNLEVLRMWAVATPKDVFPRRKIGELKSGYEASFLVLESDPLKDWSATHAIRDRWKQGQHIVVTAP
jgi:hypothetical protein